MPSADKRQRKKENARLAREAREAAVKRQRRNKLIRNGLIAAAIFAAVVGLTAWLGGGKKKSGTSSASSTTAASTTTTMKALAEVTPTAGKTYTATVKTNLGTIVFALDTKNDPKAAGHFITLAKGGVYNGSRWHRVIKGFVIQGGAPKGDPTANYGHPVVGELPKGKYPLWALAAAKTPTAPNGTFDSQFFIVTGQQGEDLPAQYAIFGSVKSGTDVVRKIEALPTDPSTQEPKSKATIDSVTISES